jgi:aldose 1-epimerase
MASPALVTLTVGNSVFAVCPQLGGSIARWSVDGQDMLRRANAAAIAAGDPLAMASFPLVPFSNRIGHARFIWAGQEIALTPNFAPEPHAIHGIGWHRSWALAEQSQTHILLTLHHDADAHWPWSFAASQKFILSENRAEIHLSATNLEAASVPLAFGHHPYFDAAGAHLSFRAAHVMMAGADALPSHSVAPSGPYDFSTGGAIAGREIDHCYTGWDGHARIRWSGRGYALDIAADMAAAVVYIPRGSDSFCFEPVSHCNNALNRTTDAPSMPIIAPGESFTATIRLDAVPA